MLGWRSEKPYLAAGQGRIPKVAIIKSAPMLLKDSGESCDLSVSVPLTQVLPEPPQLRSQDRSYADAWGSEIRVS